MLCIFGLLKKMENARMKTYCSITRVLMICHAEPKGEASGYRRPDSSLRSE